MNILKLGGERVMRLKNIYRILKDFEPIINNIKADKIGNTSEYSIKDWESVLEGLGKIKEIEIFKDVRQAIFDVSPVFSESTKTIKITATQVNVFNKWLNELRQKINAIIELCESLGYGKGDSSFEVKLPETNDLKEFSTDINELNKIFQICPFTRGEDSQIELSKTDIGSTWLEFLIKGIGVIPILTALGYVVQSALKIKSMYLTCEQQKELVRGSQIRNNLADDITELYQDMIKSASCNEVKRIEEKLDMALNPEERVSAEKSIKMLGELMSKGLEVYATLESPQEAQNVFPTVKEQKEMKAPPKMLNDTIEENLK